MAELGQQAAATSQPISPTVRARIAAAAVGRRARAGGVTLIAVGKGAAEERIEAALAAGQRVFGENYVQEAKGRWPALRPRWPGVELHLIGGLQTNKAAEAVALFDAIQTLDRPKLARELAKRDGAPDRAATACSSRSTPARSRRNRVLCRASSTLSWRCAATSSVLPSPGLMAIPPEDEDVALHTALLAKLAARNGLTRSASA